MTTSLIAKGLPHRQATIEARRIAESQAGGMAGTIPRFIRLDFAYATRSVLLVMAGVMAAATLVAFIGLRRGVQRDIATNEQDVVTRARHRHSAMPPPATVRMMSDRD